MDNEFGGDELMDKEAFDLCVYEFASSDFLGLISQEVSRILTFYTVSGRGRSQCFRT